MSGLLVVVRRLVTLETSVGVWIPSASERMRLVLCHESAPGSESTYNYPP